MTKTKENIVIPFQLIDVETKQFAVFKDNHTEGNEVGIKIGIKFRMDPDQKIIGAFTKFEFIQDYAPILVLESGCNFLIASEYWEGQIDKGMFIMPPEISSHLLVLAVGTARGIIHAKKPKYLDSVLLPTINVLNLIDGDIALSLVDPEDEEE